MGMNLSTVGCATPAQAVRRGGLLSCYIHFMWPINLIFTLDEFVSIFKTVW